MKKFLIGLILLAVGVLACSNVPQTKGSETTKWMGFGMRPGNGSSVKVVPTFSAKNMQIFPSKDACVAYGKGLKNYSWYSCGNNCLFGGNGVFLKESVEGDQIKCEKLEEVIAPDNSGFLQSIE